MQFLKNNRKAEREYLTRRIEEVKAECAAIDWLDRQRLARLNRNASGDVRRGSLAIWRDQFSEAV